MSASNAAPTVMISQSTQKVPTSTICLQMAGRLSEVVVLDADILWRPEFDQPETNYRDFFETWLRLAKNIGESGRPVVLYGAGFGVPSNVEPCIERRYFSDVHYLALVCSDEELARRLRERPQWRQSGGDLFIEQQIEFNHWFKEYGHDACPAIRILDTTNVPVAQTVGDVSHWIKAIIINSRG